MSVQSLRRNLLYCGYEDMTDYLKDSPLHRYIYKRLLEIRPRYAIETPIIRIFNEIYYQCLNAQSDRNPGLDIKERYFDEEVRWLGSYTAADLVMCFVWAFMKNKCELSFNDECFVDGLYPVISHSDFMGETNELADFIQRENIFLPYKFEPMPCPTTEMPEYHLVMEHNEVTGFEAFMMHLFGGPKFTRCVNPWQEVTDNYNHKVIEWLVLLYKSYEEQMNLARMIEDSFFEGDKEDHAAFMDRLKESIANGVYLEEGMSKNHMRRVRVSVDPDEDYDRMFAAGYNQTMEEAENDKEEQYKQERDTLKYQLEQLKKNYESDLESIEAKYQKEIAVLKEDLAKQSDDSYKEVTVKNTVPDELYMTINEIVSDAKEWFHESGASELTNMLYRYVKNHQYYTNDDLWEQIASIIPAIEKRTAPQQSISVNNADQVNINPHQVHNHPKD